MSNTKSELTTQELMFRKIGQNLKRQGVAQILDAIPFVHFIGNAWLLALKIKLGAFFKRVGTTLKSVELVTAGKMMRASAICYLLVIIIYNIRFFLVLNFSIFLLQITPHSGPIYSFYYLIKFFVLSIILIIFRSALISYEYMCFKEIKFFFINQLPGSFTKQKAINDAGSVMFNICLGFSLNRLIGENSIIAFPVNLSWLLAVKLLFLVPWSWLLWLLFAGVTVIVYAYFKLGKTFIVLSKKIESLISRDVIVDEPVAPSLNNNLVFTHRTRVVSNKVAEVLIKLMFLEILVFLILPYSITFYITRFEIRVWSYWIYFYNELILKVNFDISWFVYISFLFFINPVVTAVAIIEEIKLYKKYRGYNFIPLKTAFFIHFYINFGHVLIMGYLGFFGFNYAWAAYHRIFILPQPILLMILILILFMLVKSEAKRANRFFESHHGNFNLMDV
ncbi:MAG: hypothetical protein ACTSWN_00435 [Promethearchaeota archaeon]